MPPRGGPRRNTVARKLAAIGATNAAREEDQQVAFALARIRANPRDGVEFARLVQNDQLRLLRGDEDQQAVDHSTSSVEFKLIL